MDLDSQIAKIVKAISPSTSTVENGNIVYNYRFKNRSKVIKDTPRGKHVKKLYEDIQNLLSMKAGFESDEFVPYDQIKEQFPGISRQDYVKILISHLISVPSKV